MLTSVGMLLLGMMLWSRTEPPDISGKWTSNEWGTVELKENEPGCYEGKLGNALFMFGSEPFNHQHWTNMACANCHKGQNDFLGKIELKWSRLENRFNGNWSFPENHSGKLSVRLVENEIRGGWTTSKKSNTMPGTPRLGDLTWKRIQTSVGATEKTSSDDVAFWNKEGNKSSRQDRRLLVNGNDNFVPEDTLENHVGNALRWLSEAPTASTVAPLAVAAERFNEEMKNKLPNHGQPPLTEDELVACASWHELNKNHSKTVSGMLAAMATRHQLLEGWTIHGDFVEMPPQDAASPQSFPDRSATQSVR